MLHISRGGRWCRLGMLRDTYFEFYRAVCFSFLFFWIFCLIGPKKSALDTFGNSVEAAFPHVEIHTCILSLYHGLHCLQHSGSKLQRWGKQMRPCGRCDKPGVLSDAPRGIEVVCQHVDRWYDLATVSENRLQSIDTEPSWILWAVTLGFQLALMEVNLWTRIYMTWRKVSGFLSAFCSCLRSYHLGVWIYLILVLFIFFNGPLSLRMLLSTSSRILNNG